MIEEFAAQDYADKRNEVKNGNLLRELNKIEQVERSDIRMLETTRHRLRSKLKRFEVPHLSSGSDAMDVRMYDTHNPGFCYHCNGVMRSCNTSPRKKSIDVYDVVYPMLFTDGEVDPDKVLCLHLLAAHYAKSGSTESSGIRPITPLVEKGRKENFCGVWNTILPCYVLDIQRNVDDATNFSDEMKRHKDPLVMEAEDEIVKDFECKYERYIQENSDVGLALSTNHKRTKMIPNGIGKTTIIPPHVYSLLGAAQELKIKQAIAEESRRKKFRRSNSSVRDVDDQSISFRLVDEEDAISRRLMTATSIRGWNDPRITGASKASGFQSLSRKSGTSSNRYDPSITTLKRASPRPSNVHSLSEDIRTDTQIDDQAMRHAVSKTSSTKSPFRNFLGAHGPSSPCSNSIMSGISGPFGEPRKILRPIFINSPVHSLELRNKDYRTVPILVNNQMQAMVHSVLDILERVNPSKMQKIVSTARSPYEIRRMLIRPDIQLFIDSLAGQPLISSPNSFVVSIASIVNEIDPRVENSIEKELVATTLAVPPAPGLHRLVEEIRNNLFVDPEQMIGSKAEMRIETFGRQKQKLLEFRRPCEEIDDVFHVDISCPHSNVQETKTTCAYCHEKWKNSLPDTDRSKVPDFSLVASHESETTPENLVANETNSCEMNSGRNGKEDVQRGQDSEKKKKSRVISPSIAKNPQHRDLTEAAVVVQSRERNAFKETETSFLATESKDSNSSRSKLLLKRGAIPKGLKSTGLKTSEGSSSTRAPEQARSSLYSVERKSRLSQNTSATKLFERSIRARRRLSGQKINVDKINEARSYISGLTADCESMISTSSMKKRCSEITLRDDEPSPKCQFKPWKASQNPGYLEPDRIILRRMTNPQRILVGQMCASLKTRKINMEGLVKERTPLAALITPVLSHDALRILTKGTRRAKTRRNETTEEKDDCDTIVSEELTGPVLAKLRQAVAENETNQRLTSFLKSRV